MEFSLHLGRVKEGELRGRSQCLSMPPFDPTIDYYAVLQVHAEAHLEVIKRAYRTIIGLLQSHPDLGGSHEQAVLVNEAYAVLSDATRRAAYDAARRTLQTPAPEPPPPPPPAEGAPERLRCAWCGAMNRLPPGTPLRQAHCGHCGSALAHGAAAHVPRLSPPLREELAAHGEVRLQRTHLPADRRLHCHRCHHAWTQAGNDGRLPGHCPHCHSAEWSDLRLFQCRHCGHRFSSADLIRGPYALFPACPACARDRWHADCERHPLRWLFTLFNNR